MDIHLPIFQLSAHPLLYIWRSLKKDMRVHVSVAGYTSSLTKLVTAAGEDRPLLVSIGTGDFLAPWLTRLYHEQAVNPKARRPRLNQLVIKHLDEKLARSLVTLNVLQDGFWDALQTNLNTLRSDPYLKRYNVQIDIRSWPVVPPFHGYLCQDRILVGPWMVNESGHLHVKTPLFEAHRKAASQQYEFVRGQF